jgi:predicted alpha/beta-fold hydrolase
MPALDRRHTFPSFRPRAPWWGPDLQTLRNVMVRATSVLPSDGRQRLLLPLDDGSGDQLAGLLDRAPARSVNADGQRPLVVLIHGLSGSEDSHYMLESTHQWLALGYPVLRLNLRGAGPSRPHCRLQYHAGRTEDLKHALEALDSFASLDSLASLNHQRLRHGLVLVGYSLGGNMLLKFLAEYGAAFPIVAAASVSAPIDLAAASRRFLDRRNTFYQRHLLNSMKLEAIAEGASITREERERVRNARSIWEYDDVFVAPRNGFADAEDYYAQCNAKQFLARIPVPTLLVHARDDPWIPADMYVDHPWHENPRLVPLLSAGGGHVGFHERATQGTWFDRCIAQFVEAQLA